MMSLVDMPWLSRRSIRYFTRLPTVKVGRVALAAVAELLAHLQRGVVGHAEVAHLVAQAGERALDQEVLRRGEAALQDGDVAALGLLHGGRGHAVDPLLALGADAEPLPLGGFPGGQRRLDVDVVVGAGGRVVHARRNDGKVN
jgi:hypothetical protein